MDDPRLLEFENLTRELMESIAHLAIPDIFPWIMYLLPGSLTRRIFHLDLQKKTIHNFLNYFNKEIEEHRATLDRDDPRDLIDGYLMMMEEKADDPDNTFSEKDLAILVLDLFFAGSETTTNTLTWLFYYLATYPEVQQKMQAEIDEILPKGTLATLDDKLSIGYTRHYCYGAQERPYTSRPSVLDRPDKFLPERWLWINRGSSPPRKKAFHSVWVNALVRERLWRRMELFIFSTTVFQSLTSLSTTWQED
ncbi:Cytochrome P450 2B19-like [Homarus americanus]|uniref:Cytochrome P450 2B19-like n=1 Tax=Homarus americanus TaxID=6706 RepID=A0A8J5JXB3_HOMAM|nr:Cytochrome P450 2B19-like [Homarus americanus]